MNKGKEQGKEEFFRKVTLEVGGDDYYIDLLFYHLKLRAFVVIDLKMGKFKPEYAGKMNFYLSAVDDLVRHNEDNPSIGIILCKDKDKITVEYALKDMNKPMGVSGYELENVIPQVVQGSLPTVEELEAELARKKYSFEEVKEKVEKCINCFVLNDFKLIKTDAHELSIAHKIGEYLQKYFPEWNVDLDYNRRNKEIKKIEGERIRPDLIVHKRGFKENLLIIEIKKDNENEKAYLEDRHKIKSLTESGNYDYQFGLVDFPIG